MNPEELLNITPSPAPEILHDHSGADSVRLKVSDLTGDIRTTNYTLVPSNKLRASADTVRTGYDGSYTKKKEIQVLWGGTIKVYWEIASIGGTEMASIIYLNGVLWGGQHDTNVESYQPVSENVPVSAGDLVQLYAKNSHAPDGYAVRNFRLYWDEVKDTSIPTKYTVNLN